MIILEAGVRSGPLSNGGLPDISLIVASHCHCRRVYLPRWRLLFGICSPHHGHPHEGTKVRPANDVWMQATGLEPLGVPHLAAIPHFRDS
jgi:hypothetical protein